MGSDDRVPPSTSVIDVDALAARVSAGDRRALARAITLTESRRNDHRAAAERLLALLAPKAGGALRLAMSGTPGVGKSTFIEAFGRVITGQGRRLAVLAIDPSSPTDGGSILADKTRMTELSRDPNAYVRPSPSGGTLGGVARRSAEAILLVEAAGFDVVIVETVGVGQSETAAADLVDLFCVLLMPGSGDELQGIKKGIIERADVLIVNKADGLLLEPARRAVAEYSAALRLIRPRAGERAPVLACSALNGDGLDAVWETMARLRASALASGAWERRRAEQRRRQLWSELSEGLVERLRADPRCRDLLAEMEVAARDGALPPHLAARRVLARFLASD